MNKNIYRTLPWIALAGAILMVIGLISTYTERTQMLMESGLTRKVVEGTLSNLEDVTPNVISGENFLAAAKEAADSQYVATLWLINPEGKIVYSEGSTASQGDVMDRATTEMNRVLSSLPPNLISGEERTWLLAASTIQAEGEHNDIYNHMLRGIYAKDGSLVALVGVAYEVNSAVNGPGILYIAGLLSFIVGMGIYWMALPIWVYLDARRHGERAMVWAVFVLAGNLVALMAYLLTHKSTTT